MDFEGESNLIARFSIWDYVVFSVMLLISAVIGVYFGFVNRNKKDTKEFLVAGKSMGAFPVGMSLIASFMSAIQFLGAPSEVYQRGLLYYLIGFGYILVIFSTAFLYLPVFWNLQVTSAYQYLEKRFNKYVRTLASSIFIIQMLLYMSIAVYAPSLALVQVTGINVYVSVTSICIVCIFYTTIGGMKAVLWTDALQILVMFGSVLFIAVKGIIDGGGMQHIWDINVQGNRTSLVDWSPDPRIQNTFLSLVFGGYFAWIQVYASNQAQIQRYMCVRKKRQAVNALMINLLGLLILLVLLCLVGLSIYAKYADCDPISAGLISRPDQLFPLYVMDTLGYLKGLPGLFVAGIFAGALSTVSSGINSLAAITLEDFVKAKWPNINEEKATTLTKFFSFMYGVITFALVFVAEQLGEVLTAVFAIFGILGGPLVGLFTLGMFFPWSNSKGAFLGTLSALAVTLWIGIGSQVATYRNQISIINLPVNTCELVNINGSYVAENIHLEYSVIPQSEETDGLLLEIFKISYLLYAPIGCLSTLLFGMIISVLTGMRNLRTLNPKLLSPAVSFLKFIIPGYKLIGTDIMDEDGSELRITKDLAEENIMKEYNGNSNIIHLNADGIKL